MTIQSFNATPIEAKHRSSSRGERFRILSKKILTNYQLYLLLLPTILYFVVFKYAPMYGVQIAFKDFIAPKGIWGSEWVGLKWFEQFFNSYQFGTLLRNTLFLSIYSLVVTFPLPIILALLMNQFPSQRYRRIVQTVIYAPTFISTVVLVGMIFIFLSPRTGLVNNALVLLGGQPIQFMARADLFPSIYVFPAHGRGRALRRLFIWQRSQVLIRRCMKQRLSMALTSGNESATLTCQALCPPSSFCSFSRSATS